MRNASARYRFVAPMIAAGVLLVGCGQSPIQSTAAPAPSVNAGQDARGKTIRVPAGAPGEPVAAGLGTKSQFVTGPDPETLPEGSLYRNPANGRDEVIVADIRHTAVLIGDSQSEPLTAWTRQGLGKAGYGVFFCGLSGTGFVAANGKTGNYIDACSAATGNFPTGPRHWWSSRA